MAGRRTLTRGFIFARIESCAATKHTAHFKRLREIDFSRARIGNFVNSLEVEFSDVQSIENRNQVCGEDVSLHI